MSSFEVFEYIITWVLVCLPVALLVRYLFFKK